MNLVTAGRMAARAARRPLAMRSLSRSATCFWNGLQTASAWIRKSWPHNLQSLNLSRKRRLRFRPARGVPGGYTSLGAWRDPAHERDLVPKCLVSVHRRHTVLTRAAPTSKRGGMPSCPPSLGPRPERDILQMPSLRVWLAMVPSHRIAPMWSAGLHRARPHAKVKARIVTSRTRWT